MTDVDEERARRRNRLLAGVGLLLVSLALQVALFVTPLERLLWRTSVWFAVVTGLQIASVAAFCSTWAAKRDALGLTALTLAVLTLLVVLGWLCIFVGIKALSGLR